MDKSSQLQDTLFLKARNEWFISVTARMQDDRDWYSNNFKHSWAIIRESGLEETFFEYMESDVPYIFELYIKYRLDSQNHYSLEQDLRKILGFGSWQKTYF